MTVVYAETSDHKRHMAGKGPKVLVDEPVRAEKPEPEPLTSKEPGEPDGVAAAVKELSDAWDSTPPPDQPEVERPPRGKAKRKVKNGDA